MQNVKFWQCKRLHVSSFSTFTFFSQTPYSSDFPVKPLSFVPSHLTSNSPDYHTNRISTFDSAFFPPNITCYDSTDNYCKSPQQLCSNTATALQCRCNQLCSSTATALQCRCNLFAVTLQQVCNDAAFPCSEADNKQLPICAPLTEGGYKTKQASPKKPMNSELERKGERDEEQDYDANLPHAIQAPEAPASLLSLPLPLPRTQSRRLARHSAQ